MKITVLTAISLLAMAGCSAVRTGPDPTPGIGLRGILNVSGDFGGQVLADQVPLTALIRGHGVATLTVRPLPPFLTIDGSWNVIVEPAPMREAEAIAAVQRGDILIRKSGVPVALNAPGSIAGYKAALEQMYAPKAAPLPPPPPLPLPAEKAKPMALDEPECEGTSCSIPMPR